MGLFSGIKKIAKGIGKIASGLSQIANVFKNILNSPLGNILKMVFPQLGLAQGALSFTSMLGGLGNSVGGGQNYY